MPYQKLLKTNAVAFKVMCGVDPTPLDGHMGDPMYASFDPIFWYVFTQVLTEIVADISSIGFSKQLSDDLI